MQTVPTSIELVLPDWLEGIVSEWPIHASLDEQMARVVELSRRNVESRTGGPFAAAVIDARDGALLSAGVNVVEKAGASIAHAEVMALSLAQKRVGSFDLSADGRRLTLLASAAPCAMCLGACCWSGISSLVCAARGSDVEAIGFDEGPVPDDWVRALQARGIEVRNDVLRDEAVQVLRDYRQAGGRIYNAER